MSIRQLIQIYEQLEALTNRVLELERLVAQLMESQNGKTRPYRRRNPRGD